MKSTGNATWTPTSGLSLRTGTTLSGDSAVTNGSEQGVFGPYKTYLPGQKVTITVRGDNLTNGYPVVYTNYGRYQTRDFTVEAATVMNTDIHLPYQADLHLQQIPTGLLQIPDRIHILSGNSVSMQGVLHG